MYSFSRAFIAALAGRLDRRMGLTMSVSDRHLFVRSMTAFSRAKSRDTQSRACRKP